MMNSPWRAVCMGFACLLLAGCFSPEVSEPPRYYQPYVELDFEGETPDNPLLVRIDRVESLPFLNENMVWRLSETEVGHYSDRVWSNTPSALFEYVLGREFFLVRGWKRSESLDQPSVRVVVLRLDDVLQPGHEASFAAILEIIDPSGRHRPPKVFVVRETVVGDDGTAFAKAAGKALMEGARQMADHVEAVLGAPSSPGGS